MLDLLLVLGLLGLLGGTAAYQWPSCVDWVFESINMDNPFRNRATKVALFFGWTKWIIVAVTLVYVAKIVHSLVLDTGLGIAVIILAFYFRDWWLPRAKKILGLA